MIPFDVLICIIVAQCLCNLLGIWVLSKENKGKDDVIEKLSNQLRDKDVLARLYKHLWEAKEKDD